MDKGIRPAANAKFVELLPQRQELGNTKFRKTIMSFLMENFGCTNPAAATHYNHAFKEAKKATPHLVEGLGRPEGKNNGGRKKKPVLPEAASAPVEEATNAAAPATAAVAAVAGEAVNGAPSVQEAVVATVAAAINLGAAVAQATGNQAPGQGPAQGARERRKNNNAAPAAEAKPAEAPAAEAKPAEAPAAKPAAKKPAAKKAEAKPAAKPAAKKAAAKK